MNRRRLPVVAGICCLWLLVSGRVGAEEIEVFILRLVPSDADSVQLNGTWVGLCPSDHAQDEFAEPSLDRSYDLVEVEVRATVVDDPEILEFFDGPALDLEAICPSGHRPVLVLRGLPGPFPRPARTAKREYAGDDLLYLGRHLALELGEQRWLLTALGCTNADGWLVDTSLRIEELRSKGLRQTLEIGGRGDSHYNSRLVWAGDLDDDGLLDLWLSTYDGDGSTREELFFSSTSQERENVSPSAEINLGPCC